MADTPPTDDAARAGPGVPVPVRGAPAEPPGRPLEEGTWDGLDAIEVDEGSAGPVELTFEGHAPFEVLPGHRLSWTRLPSPTAVVRFVGGACTGTMHVAGGPPAVG